MKHPIIRPVQPIRYYRGCVILRNPVNGMWFTSGSGTTMRRLAADTLRGMKQLIRHEQGLIIRAIER